MLDLVQFPAFYFLHVHVLKFLCCFVLLLIIISSIIIIYIYIYIYMYKASFQESRSCPELLEKLPSRPPSGFALPPRQARIPALRRAAWSVVSLRLARRLYRIFARRAVSSKLFSSFFFFFPVFFPIFSLPIFSFPHGEDTGRISDTRCAYTPLDARKAKNNDLPYLTRPSRLG